MITLLITSSVYLQFNSVQFKPLLSLYRFFTLNLKVVYRRKSIRRCRDQVFYLVLVSGFSSYSPALIWALVPLLKLSSPMFVRDLSAQRSAAQTSCVLGVCRKLCRLLRLTSLEVHEAGTKMHNKYILILKGDFPCLISNLKKKKI